MRILTLNSVTASGDALVLAVLAMLVTTPLNFLPVARVKNLFYTCRDLQKSGLTLVAITEKTPKSMYETDFSIPVAMVMGSEEDGISNDLMGIVDEKVNIPMLGRIESLNVSVSAGVAIYEAMRQRKK